MTTRALEEEQESEYLSVGAALVAPGEDVGFELRTGNRDFANGRGEETEECIRRLDLRSKD